MSRTGADVRVLVIACSLAVAAGVAGCAVPGEPVEEPVSSVAPARPAPEVADGARPALVGEPRWRAPFDDMPNAVADVFVGVIYPKDDQSALSIVGVDGTGVTRWSVETDPACLSFGVSEAAGRAVAVVLSNDGDARAGKLATTVAASAYDVHTGKRVWGPVTVPGPVQGPGLIFWQNSPSVVGADAETGKLMLAAATGEPVPGPAGSEPVYEHDGVGLFSRDGELTAVDTSTGATLWRSPDLAGGRAEPADAPRASDRDVIAVRWERQDGTVETVLHDLRSGRAITTAGAGGDDLRTTVLPDAGAVVVADPAGARAVDRATGEVRWERADGAALDLTVVDGDVVYGSADGRSVAVDIRTGKTVATGSWPVPWARAEGGVLLAPVQGGGDGARVAGSGQAVVAYRRA
ncbi:PQQ-binding-like beta-propeller repeat protein [Actinophytocola sp. NPDC049390]|uniref:outer membrane protein assembly factor BamB family protein n=1 Tax=Actinophytocola sp. NPDC049390 TaxID=3363894 RepID=UPI0037946BD9